MTDTLLPSLADRVCAIAQQDAPIVGVHFLGGTPVFVLGEEALLFAGDAEKRVAAHGGAILVSACDVARVVTGGDDGRLVATAADGEAHEIAADVKKRWIQIAGMSNELQHAEQADALIVHRAPDPTFVAIAFAWAAGEGFAEVVEDEELTGGDFVRTMKQLIDLLRQLALIAPLAETRRCAEQAADALFRGVVAASSAVDTEPVATAVDTEAVQTAVDTEAVQTAAVTTAAQADADIAAEAPSPVTAPETDINESTES